MNKIRYHVCTVTEGGADFEDYSAWEDIPIDVNPWFNTDGGARVRDELAAAEIGDEIALDGCSTCYVLKVK